MTIKPIRSDADYQAALVEIERLFDAKPGTQEFDHLDLLATLVHAYEAKHHPIAPPDPIAAIEYEIEKRGLTRRDLEPIIGSSGRVSEILNKKRRLTYTMLRNLHNRLGISGDTLLGDYALNRINPTDRARKAVFQPRKRNASAANDS